LALQICIFSQAIEFNNISVNLYRQSIKMEVYPKVNVFMLKNNENSTTKGFKKVPLILKDFFY